MLITGRSISLGPALCITEHQGGSDIRLVDLTISDTKTGVYKLMMYNLISAFVVYNALACQTHPQYVIPQHFRKLHSVVLKLTLRLSF